MDTPTNVHTYQVNLIDIEINAKTKEEVLETISAEFDKCPHPHHFLGRFSGMSRSEMIENADENAQKEMMLQDIEEIDRELKKDYTVYKKLQR